MSIENLEPLSHSVRNTASIPIKIGLRQQYLPPSQVFNNVFIGEPSQNSKKGKRNKAYKHWKIKNSTIDTVIYTESPKTCISKFLKLMRV